MPEEPITKPTPEISSDAVAEAIRAYQGETIGSTEEDPMVKAIQDEIGKRFVPASATSGPIDLTAQVNTTMAPHEIFRCTNLTKSYGQGVAYTEVIKGISFSVKQGEFVVIYGPSGSGKSTLLHLLAGLEIPSRGEIRIRNQVIQEFNDTELAFYHREEIGLVFQSFNLLASLRVWENVAFPLMLSGAPIEWREHQALKMLEQFGMLDFANHYPSQLSGGQQQRVSLARALVHDPDILLVDEPTGNLDSASATRVLHELDRLHKQEERTIILVTHSEVFLPLASRVFYIKDGTLLTTDEQSSLNSANRPNDASMELAPA